MIFSLLLHKRCNAFAMLIFCQSWSLGSPFTVGEDCKAVFSRESEIWTIREDGSNLRQLTSDLRRWVRPVWSLNGDLIAYLTPPLDRESVALSLVQVIDESGKSVASVEVFSNHVMNAVESIEWHDNHSIGIEGHMNPPKGEYRVSYIRSGTAVNSYLGARFSLFPDRSKLAHLGWVPHFAPERLKGARIEINGKRVCPPESDNRFHENLSMLRWSQDSSRLAFLDRVK